MKLIIQQVIIGAVLAIMLFVLSGCKEIFHSKEDINYTKLVLDMEHNDSVGKKEKDYYKFYAEQGKTYNVNLKKSDYYASIDISAFWYDTEETVIGELNFSDDYDWEKTPFTASRSGNVVIRVTSHSDNYSGYSYTIKITQ